ncbi:MAG: DUF1592 domain-containing protein [Phycisphaera sp.]|nr:MAG: DUF1592 domain-containing protein [Phycisphaera sp.]
MSRVSPASAQEPETTAAEIETEFVDSIEPLLFVYCYECHNDSRSKGGVSFENIGSIKSMLEASEDLEIARELVETLQMPPGRRAKPVPEERETLTKWIDRVLGYTPPSGTIDPGWATIHRLNKNEYENTLRDLLGIDARRLGLASSLPPDDVGYGFDNIADVLTISPLHLEAYLEAAEQAVEAALGPEITIGNEPRLLPNIQRAGRGRPLRQGGQFFSTNGSLRSRTSIPITGDYMITLHTWGTQGGDDLPHLSLRVNGKPILSMDVNAESEAEAKHVKVPITLEAGDIEISAHFTNDYWVPNVADRNLAIDGLCIAGPLTEESIRRPAMYAEVFETQMRDQAEARQFVKEFLPKAFRRTIGQSEQRELMGLYESTRSEGGTHEHGIRQMMTATLVSPSFLYRSTSLSQEAQANEVIHTLTGYELASRLSYFLWSSMPDDELFSLAESGDLLKDDVLKDQVRRMLADERSDAFVRNFAGQWLLLRNLESIEIDQGLFTTYDTELMHDMTTEAELFFADILRSDRSILDLIDADDVFINERLAMLYGLENIEGNDFRRVQLPESSVRGGVLTMGSTLTVTSNPTRTSPVKRGLYVLEQLLGTPPPPPPPDIPRLETSAAEVGSQASLREQLEAHLTDSSCAACHVRMDPIGLAMENFDAVGGWRDAYENAPIDASGVLPGGISFDGPNELKAILLDKHETFREHLAGEILTYAVGRGMEPFDRPTIRLITEHTASNGDTLSSMIEGVVLSGTFRTCRRRDLR